MFDLTTTIYVAECIRVYIITLNMIKFWVSLLYSFVMILTAFTIIILFAPLLIGYYCDNFNQQWNCSFIIMSVVHFFLFYPLEGVSFGWLYPRMIFAVLITSLFIFIIRKIVYWLQWPKFYSIFCYIFFAVLIVIICHFCSNVLRLMPLPHIKWLNPLTPPFYPTMPF